MRKESMRWSDDDLARLRHSYASISVPSLALILKRSEKAIREKAFALGLTRGKVNGTTRKAKSRRKVRNG